MKKTKQKAICIASILITLLLFGTTSLHAQAHVQLLQNKTDFGKVQEGKILNYEFRFINSGNQPLVISKIQQGCGCVATSYPVYPVTPGDTASVYTKFVTNGKKGRQNQRIMIFSNADNSPTEIRIKCDVIVRS